MNLPGIARRRGGRIFDRHGAPDQSGKRPFQIRRARTPALEDDQGRKPKAAPGVQAGGSFTGETFDDADFAIRMDNAFEGRDIFHQGPEINILAVRRAARMSVNDECFFPEADISAGMAKSERCRRDFGGELSP